MREEQEKDKTGRGKGFFTSIPSHAFIYAVPYAWYEKYPQSRVKVFVIPPNEELMIAEDTFAVTTGRAFTSRGINEGRR